MNAGQRAVVERLMQSFEEKTMQVTDDFCRGSSVLCFSLDVLPVRSMLLNPAEGGQMTVTPRAMAAAWNEEGKISSNGVPLERSSCSVMASQCSSVHISVKRRRIRRSSERRTVCIMADDTTKRDYRDRDRINVHEDYELRYWTKELGVTPEKLKQTVEKVGVMATDVRKALGKMKKDQKDGPGIEEGDTD
jgi:hypothetical protein